MSESNKKMKKSRNKKSSLNIKLITILLVVSLFAVVGTVFNITHVWKSAGKSRGEETSLTSKTDRDLKNDLYVIGNNPTDVEKKYFNELTEAINSNDQMLYAEKVVESFVSDYFTWTNKDGNYEVGGLQYIYGPKFTAFDDWSRWNYYKDLDLYIHQYGRENLPEVKEITLDKPVEKVDDFVVETEEDKVPRPCYLVQVSWTYQSSMKPSASEFPKEARFLVIENGDRMEIVEFYDMESVREWEVKHKDDVKDETESSTKSN